MKPLTDNCDHQFMMDGWDFLLIFIKIGVVLGGTVVFASTLFNHIRI